MQRFSQQAQSDDDYDRESEDGTPEDESIDEKDDDEDDEYEGRRRSSKKRKNPPPKPQRPTIPGERKSSRKTKDVSVSSQSSMRVVPFAVSQSLSISLMLLVFHRMNKGGE